MSGLRVGVVAGGPSAEAAVSRASAAGVSRALAEAGHTPRLIELGPGLPAALSGVEVVFPAVHGRMGEDGCVQGLFEVLGVPYVGSGVLASALAMSKPHAKCHFRAAALPVAAELVVSSRAPLEGSARSILAELGSSVVVKPGAGGSAIGVEILREATVETLVAALGRAFATDAEVLVETFVVGKEVTCGVLEDADGTARALPPTLILPKAAGFYDFQSKYAPSGSVHLCPPPFAEALVQAIQSAAVKAHESLGCRDLSRVDFVVDDDRSAFTVLEVNTLPGMTATSLFPEAAAKAGISFPSLCDRLVKRALARPRPSDVVAVPMPC